MKNVVKKILCAVFSAILLLYGAACGKNGTENAGNGSDHGGSEVEEMILFEDGKRYKESQKDNGGIKESLNGEKNNYQFSARAVIDRYHDLLNLADMGVHLRIHLREELRAPVAYDLGGLLRGGYAGIRHGVEHGWHKKPRQHADYRHDHNKLNKGEPLF